MRTKKSDVEPSLKHYKIVFEDDVISGKKHWRDFLAGWLRSVEIEPVIAERVTNDALEQKDLFWLNDYCRHMVGFNMRRFEFQSTH